MIGRRGFLGKITTGGILGCAAPSLLAALPPVPRDEARLDPGLVRLDSGIAPLVKLLEETPREKILGEIASRIRKGTGYRDIVTALLLAGVRTVQPRPSVGFKFHCVLVINSAHMASLAGPDSERWLPIFWAIDDFKSSQADERRRSRWTQGAVDEKAVPAPEKAARAFTDAMDRWDDEAGDAAAAGIVRGLPANRVFDLLARYGARDFRSIGHKAIFVSGGWRLLHRPPYPSILRGDGR